MRWARWRAWMWVGLAACVTPSDAKPLDEGTSGDVSRAPLHVVERPLPFGRVRQELTLAYVREHYGEAHASLEMVPRVVVLHWTATETLEAAWRTFAPERLPASRSGLAGAGQVNVSTQYLVDRDGRVVKLMPETWVGRHVIGLNACAIGVENVGNGTTHPQTEAQVHANARLVRELAARHPLTHVIGHHEYRSFEGHPYFLERDASYRTTKVDPGEAFVAAVFAEVADLGLSRAP